MMNYFQRFVCFYAFVAMATVAATPVPTPSEAETCQYWNNVTYGFSQMNRGNDGNHVTCTTHSKPCNGFDCTGTYGVQIPGLPRMSLGFCMGITLNHCDNPLSMDYYIQIPSRNASFSDRVRHNESKPLGNLSFHEAGAIVKPYMFFTLERKDYNYILFKIRLKCKVTTVLHIFPNWPDILQMDLFPEQMIPYTPCGVHDSVPLPPQKLPTCNPNAPPGTVKPGKPTTKPSVTKTPPIWKTTKKPVKPTKSVSSSPQTLPTSATKTPQTVKPRKPTRMPSSTIYPHVTQTLPTLATKTSKTVKPGKPTRITSSTIYPHVKTTKKSFKPTKSATLGKKCTIGLMSQQCGTNELCRKTQSGASQCDCEPNYQKFHGNCKVIKDMKPIFPPFPGFGHSTPSVIASTQKHKSATALISHTESGTKLNMTALVVGSVLGGLIVIVLIVTIIIFAVRRKRIYRGHQLLLTEDDTDVVI